jgi:hypothetical protein
MSEICRLVIPANLSKTNPNRATGHWAGLYRAKKALKADAEKIWLVAGRPRSKTPVRVNVIARCWQKMDRDNIVASLKACFDGLFKGAITEDDSPEWVTIGTVEQENGKQWRLRPEVEIIVEEMAG